MLEVAHGSSESGTLRVRVEHPDADTDSVLSVVDHNPTLSLLAQSTEVDDGRASQLDIGVAPGTPTLLVLHLLSEQAAVSLRATWQPTP